MKILNSIHSKYVIVILVWVFFLTLSAYKYYQVEDIRRNGKTIEVEVIWRERCLSSEVNHYFRFNYQGREWTEGILPINCDSFQVKSKIKLLHIDGDDTFLFPNDTNRDAKIGVVGLSLILLLTISMWVFKRGSIRVLVYYTFALLHSSQLSIVILCM